MRRLCETEKSGEGWTGMKTKSCVLLVQGLALQNEGWRDSKEKRGVSNVIAGLYQRSPLDITPSHEIPDSVPRTEVMKEKIGKLSHAVVATEASLPPLDVSCLERWKKES